MLAVLGQFVVAVALVLFLSVVSVSEDGIVLYLVYRLRWPQVMSVRRVSFLGLPYLHITRIRGFNWWLPLYFTGSRPIEQALAEKAPPGNPLRTYAAPSNT
jgi:hypothetical protein